jgi:hypothetical protein
MDGYIGLVCRERREGRVKGIIHPPENLGSVTADFSKKIKLKLTLY